MIKKGGDLDSKYKIITCLKKKVDCEVYKAFDVELNMFVVIKCKSIVGKLSTDCEGAIYKKIRHSGLPHMYDVFIEGNKEYIVMEYINGITLEKFVKSRCYLSANEVVFYSIQLCNIIDYLHSRDIPIIHGDIKPANIILRRNGNIALIDFDVAYQLNQYTTRYGYSDEFCSPEQKSVFSVIDRMKTNKGLMCSNNFPASYFVDRPHKKNELWCGKNNIKSVLNIGISIDIYGIGSTMFYMLTGESINKINSINKFKIEGKIKKIIMKATKNIMDERYKNAFQIKSELNKIYFKKTKDCKELI